MHHIPPDEDVPGVDVVVGEDHGGPEAGHRPQQPLHLRAEVGDQELDHGGRRPLLARHAVQLDGAQLGVVTPARESVK